MTGGGVDEECKGDGETLKIGNINYRGCIYE